jgi:arylsulfatase A-like enzyme
MHKSITQLASTTIVVAVLGAVASHAAAAAERPNVLVILTDDQGWGDLSVHGNTNLSTPNVDSLAHDGARFERFYVCPVCSPTRAEFLTGRYHPRSGVHQTSKGGERMDLDEATIAEDFKVAGYATACFGKWHNGAQYPYHPNGRGFEEFYGFTSGHYANYFSPQLDQNGKLAHAEDYLIDDFTDHAIRFIRAQQSVVHGSPDPAQKGEPRPFFAFVAYNSPHSPMQVPDRWWNKFKDKELKLVGTEPHLENVNHTRAALAMCENIDWNVGRLLARLDELGIADNTIVVYFCDNGPNGNRWTAGLKGVKGTTDEGGVRSPLFIRWPAGIKPGTQISRIAGAIDLRPTLNDLAGIYHVGEKPLDGVSLEPLLTSTETDIDAEVAAELRDRVLFSHWGGRVSAVDEQFRLDQTGKLYDLRNDPRQTTNVANEFPRDKDRLAAAVEAWKRDVLSELEAEDTRPLIVGHPDRDVTFLPAADGRPHGKVKWSSQHPNSSYFTNWKSTDDRITWDVEVATTGDYTIDAFYTCPDGQIGSTVVLRFKDYRIMTQVEDPHDPPLIGAERDRVPRGESYTKEFRPQMLGTIRLEKGRGQIVLHALDVSDKVVMDLQMLKLRRVSR